MTLAPQTYCYSSLWCFFGHRKSGDYYNVLETGVASEMIFRSKLYPILTLLALFVVASQSHCFWFFFFKKNKIDLQRLIFAGKVGILRCELVESREGGYECI
jgi:hypothetical protein